MELLRTIFGLVFIATGLGLTAHALYLLRKNHWQEALDLLRVDQPKEAHPIPPPPEEAPQPRGESVKAEPDAKPEIITKDMSETPPPVLFEKAVFQERLHYRDIPLKQTGRDQHYDLETWGRMIAWLIYSRLEPGVSGRVGSPLSPTMSKGRRIDDHRRMARFNWIRLFVDEAVAQVIRAYYNLDKHELDAKLKLHTENALESFLEPTVFTAWHNRLVVRLYERDKKGDTVFDADFLPLLDNTDDQLSCEAHLILGSNLGQVMFPREEHQNRFRFADRDLNLKHGYLPLVGEFAHTLDIGPSAACHVQTRQQYMASTLTLGWRQADEVGVAGILEVRAIEQGSGETETFHLRRKDAEPELLNAGERARIPDNEDGRQTTCEIWRRVSGRENLVLTLVIRECKPPLDDLPDCAIFEEGLARVSVEKDMARLIASQIYFSTKRGKNSGGILFLDSNEGREFRDDPNHGPVFRKGRTAEPLRCRVRLCVAPGQLSRLHEWLGDRDMPRVLAAKIMELLGEDEDYIDAFPENTLDAFAPGEGTPGLTIDVGSDETLGADAVLVRCLPVFVPSRRREIFGRFHFDAWSDATDLSDFSCGDHLTYFTDHPSGTVALHLSRFPVYEVQLPRVFGAVKMHIVEAGTRKARFEISNQSAGVVVIDGKQLHRTNSHSVSFGEEDTRLTLEMGGKVGTIQLYGKPAAQLDEPFFVPEPARLQLYGLTLNRRLERTAWQSDPRFKKLWENPALEENRELLGVSQVTANGFMAVVARGVRQEHHFFAGESTVLQRAGRETIAAGACTFTTGALPDSCRFYEQGRENVQVDYRRLELNGGQVRNLGLLTEDYWDTFIEDIEPLLPEGYRVTRVELVRCDADRMDQKGAHLYIVETSGDSGNARQGWLFQPEAGIQGVRMRNRSLEHELDTDKALVGPLGTLEGRLFLVDWQGEQGTPVSFEVEDHQDQVRQYLSDGFFSLVEGMGYVPGGKLGRDVRTYHSDEPMYLSSEPLHIHYDRDGRGSQRTLNFDPREFVSFFDKDSFRLFYSGAAQSFVMASELHRKETITPKTVFLVIPEGGQPVLGSHALPQVKVPGGSSYLVLPGLVFKFSQGPVYYA